MQELGKLKEELIKRLGEKKDVPKGECLCHAYSESECGCGNYPSDRAEGYNECHSKVIEILND